MDNLVIFRVELVMRSNNSSSEHDLGFVSDPGGGNFSGNVEENPRMTASSRLNSNTDTNKIEETRSNTTVEAFDFPVIEAYFDQ